MIKCYFVDVKSISSTIPKSKFKKAEIDRLADTILAAGGLLRPLILQQAGVEKYTVIEGHREYYAAVSAKAKDIKKAEMVNAFIIDANSHKSAIDQLDLLTISQSPSPVVDPTPEAQGLIDLLAKSIDRLLPTLTAMISSQLQPIFTQLTEHQQILDAIKSALVNQQQYKSVEIPAPENTTPPVPQVDPIEPKVSPVIEPPPKTSRQKKSKVVETLGADAPDLKTTKAPKSSRKTKPATSIPVPIEPDPQIITTAPSPKITKPVETNQTAAIGSIESEKSTNALNLINTLSQDDLTMRMQRSAVLPAIVKLVPTIVSQRTNQPAQRFDTWEDIIKLKISGLTVAKVQDIIKKLR